MELFSLFFTIALTLCLAQTGQSQIDYTSLTVYAGPTEGLARISFTTAVDQRELPQMDHMIVDSRTLYSSDAAWIAYFYLNYTTRGWPTTGAMFTGYGFPRSLRKVGPPGVDHSATSIDLYAGDYFTLASSTHTSDVPNVSNFSSLILLGSQPVQLFQQPNYVGFSYCLRPDFTDSCNCTAKNLADIGVTPGSVKSIKFGCNSASKVIDSSSTTVNDNVVKFLSH